MFTLFTENLAFAPVKTSDLQEPPTKRRRHGSKVSSLVLPEEEMMRRFVEHIEHPPAPWKQFASPCNWKGVKCDAEKRITAIHWNYNRISGSLAWAYLPHDVQTMEARCPAGLITKLSGKLLSTDLHKPLSTLLLTAQNHTGELDLTQLPESMRYLDVGFNELAGPCDLTQLPQILEKLNLITNAFEGEIRLDMPPPNLRELFLSRNRYIFSHTRRR